MDKLVNQGVAPSAEQVTAFRIMFCRGFMSIMIKKRGLDMKEPHRTSTSHSAHTSCS